jgi:hypothetical protein
VTPAAVTAWSKVGNIETSHFDAETAYAAVDRHRLDDYKPYVYRTHDGGKNWQMIADGIPNGSFVNVVREDSGTKGLLYLGTERGMYISFDDGDHWQSLQKNLPITSVRDIDVHGNDLIIATHGRAFWIMDNISPLREANVTPASSRPYLFKPATAVRERPAGFTGTPMPKDEAMAPNPPAGAAIDYIAAGSPVAIEIYDANDKLVRRYSSTDAATPPNLARLNTAPEWASTPQTLQTTPGMHRFVWSLRYPAPAGVGTRRGGGDGVWAPPGTYKVVLVSGDQKLTQPLTVAPDPRIKLPAAAYAEQFAIAKRVEALRVRVTGAIAEGDAAAAKLAVDDPLRKRIAEVVGGTYLPTGPNVELSPSSLRFIDAALQKIAGAVDSADAAPTQDAREGLAKLEPLAEAALTAWSKVKPGS